MFRKRTQNVHRVNRFFHLNQFRRCSLVAGFVFLPVFVCAKKFLFGRAKVSLSLGFFHCRAGPYVFTVLRFCRRHKILKFLLMKRSEKKRAAKCNNELEMCSRMCSMFLLCHSLHIAGACWRARLGLLFLLFTASVVVLFCSNIVCLLPCSRVAFRIRRDLLFVPRKLN